MTHFIHQEVVAVRFLWENTVCRTGIARQTNVKFVKASLPPPCGTKSCMSYCQTEQTNICMFQCHHQKIKIGGFSKYHSVYTHYKLKSVECTCFAHPLFGYLYFNLI